MSARRPLLALFIGAIALAGIGEAAAQGWPQSPVKVLVPYAAGGNTDIITRIVAQRLSDVLGQQFIVENRTGAGGAIALEAVARATPDGYTLVMSALPQIAIVPLMAKVTYDPVKDLAPISNVGTNPFVLAVHSSVPAKTVKEFVDYVRSQSNPMVYGTPGVGSLSHLSMVLFLKRAGIDMTPVHYRGNAQALNDLIAGHVPALFLNVSEAVPHATDSAIRLLGVSDTKRSAQLANVPTIDEAGYPGFRTITWNGLFAPAGTPKEIIERIAKEVANAVKDPKFADRLVAYGVDPLGDGPKEFAPTISEDIARWAEAVKAANIAAP